MALKQDLLKLCPIYTPKADEKYSRTISMVVCDAEQFLSATLYIAGHNLRGDQLNYYVRGVLTSPEYAEWLKQYNLSFTATACILEAKQASLNKYAVCISGTELKLFERAYSPEQAKHQAVSKLHYWTNSVDLNTTVELI